MSNHAALFADLGKQVKSELVRKDDEIDAIVLALVARHHVLFLGEPGVAKTLGAERLVDRIDGCHKFYRAMGAFTAPQHIFGQISIAGIKNDEQRYVTTGKLPEADIAIFDEWTRAGNAVLSEFLQATNERTFEQAGVIEKMPLMTGIFLCNFLLSDSDAQELMALYDRIMLRKVSEPILDAEGLRALAAVDLDPDPAPVLTISQVKEAQATARKVTVPDEVVEAHIEVFGQLTAKNLRPSGRRFRESLALVRANAYLNDRGTATLDDLLVLSDVFWNETDQRRTVEKIVWETCSPAMREISELIDGLAAVQTEVDDALAVDDNDGSLETGALAARKKIKRYAKAAQKVGGSERADRAAADVWRRLQVLHDRIMDALEMERIPLERALEV